MYGRLFFKATVVMGVAVLCFAGTVWGEESKAGPNDATVIAKVGDRKSVV